MEIQETGGEQKNMKRTRIKPKATSNSKKNRRYMTKYYQRLRKDGKKVFTLVTPEATIPILKLFNQQLCLAYKKHQDEKQNAEQTNNTGSVFTKES